MNVAAAVDAKQDDSASTRSPLGYVWRALSLAALACVVVAYFVPTWWVSLKAPNYPEHTFPVGIRIHFHVDGVRNGCEIRTSKEVTEKEALDCVHEMDTINHFVGMFPIASGGPVEKTFSPFLFAFLGVLIVGFVVPQKRLRLILMGAGFLAVAAWMSLAMFMPGGMNYLSRGYAHAMVNSLGADDEGGSDENLHPIVRQLKESLAKSGIGAAPAKVSKEASKAELINVLRGAYEQDQSRTPAEAQRAWNGSAMQVFAWHYERSLGRWFNQPERNHHLVTIMRTVAYTLFAGILAAMVLFLFLARNDRSPLFLALALAPMVLPVVFILEYGSWLWWYGHTLNEMGAFTLKPFMPTVFGQGKVAQFTTLSYPHLGFGLMAAVGVLMLVAVLVRRRERLGA
jgi:hypothetical protein